MTSFRTLFLAAALAVPALSLAADAPPAGPDDYREVYRSLTGKHAGRAVPGAGREQVVAAERGQVVLARLVEIESRDVILGKAGRHQLPAGMPDFFLQLKMSCDNG